MKRVELIRILKHAAVICSAIAGSILFTSTRRLIESPRFHDTAKSTTSLPRRFAEIWKLPNLDLHQPPTLPQKPLRPQQPHEHQEEGPRVPVSDFGHHFFFQFRRCLGQALQQIR